MHVCHLSIEGFRGIENADIALGQQLDSQDWSQLTKLVVMIDAKRHQQCLKPNCPSWMLPSECWTVLIQRLS